MSKTIYEFRDYKAYLREFMRNRPGKGYGFRSQIAKTARCNTAYVSQVLNHDAHFSAEQAEDLNELLGHTREESEFFLLLVQWARAGTARLKNRILQLINERIEKSQVLKTRVDIKHNLSDLDQIRYYSAWYYAAVHILIAIPEYQTREAIARRLGLSADKVSQILEFLISVQLAQKQGENYSIGINRVFLGKDSIMISKHHTNWRIKTIDVINQRNLQIENDLHLSTVLSFARKDVHLVKEKLIQGVEEARKIVRDSNPEEDIYCLGLDFFRL